MYLFGNAPICASTVLECSCCRIHRNVAAPSVTGFINNTEVLILFFNRNMNMVVSGHYGNSINYKVLIENLIMSAAALLKTFYKVFSMVILDLTSRFELCKTVISEQGRRSLKFLAVYRDFCIFLTVQRDCQYIFFHLSGPG